MQVVPAPQDVILVAPSKILMIKGVGPTSWFAVAVKVTLVLTGTLAAPAERETDQGSWPAAAGEGKKAKRKTAETMPRVAKKSFVDITLLYLIFLHFPKPQLVLSSQQDSPTQT